MKKFIKGQLLVVVILTLLQFQIIDSFAQDYEVGVYYFPSYHIDPRNEAMYGQGWTEWDLMQHVRPRFDGHDQPKVPLWGYEDEADPKVMERKIEVADRYGVDFFIFDWYYYDSAEFLNRALDEGYFGAANNADVPFCLMWANHHWRDLFPMKLNTAPLKWTANEVKAQIWSGHVAGELFDQMTDLIIEKYFKHPAYYKIDGAPYFSIFEVQTFIDGFGSEKEAAKAIQKFRKKTIAAGFKDLHFNIVGRGFNVGDNSKAISKTNRLIKDMGARSVNMYNAVSVNKSESEAWPKLPYSEVIEGADRFWKSGIFNALDVPYFPTLSMGWDVSPRTVQSDRYENRGYPFSVIWTENTPEQFQKGLEVMKGHMDQAGQKTCIINAWNEWTEGSYLEPDIKNGYRYLEAVRQVFGAK
jgi:hypothetical protein